MSIIDDFEKHFSGVYGMAKDSLNQYVNADTAAAWDGWQAARAQKGVKRCSWWKDMADWDGNTWEADCGACWVFIDEGPAQNEMNYCPKCGRKVSVLPAAPDMGGEK